jgi:dihydroorotate dehydrogenase
MLYKHILKPLLFHINPELVHNIFLSVGEFLGEYYATRKLVWIIYGYTGKDISRTIDGITYKTPIILSAGFDYNA